MQKLALYVCISLIVGSIFHMLVPSGNLKNSMKFTINIFLICIICVPLIGQLSSIDFSKYSNVLENNNQSSENLEEKTEEMDKKRLENALKIVLEKNGYIDLDISIDIDKERKTTSIVIEIPKNKNYEKKEIEKIVKQQTGINAKII